VTAAVPAAAAAVAAPRAQLASQPHYAAQPAAAVMAPRSPAFDVGAVDVHIEMDGALDGRKRRRRTVGTLVVLILLVFGGLFGALFLSYQPH
jgi:hypothetical protein